MVIISLMIFLFMVITISIPVFGLVALTRTHSVIENWVMSLDCFRVMLAGSNETVPWSPVLTSISIVHT